MAKNAFFFRASPGKFYHLYVTMSTGPGREFLTLNLRPNQFASPLAML